MSDRAGVSNYGEGFTQEHIAYALWIRQHLRQSTISQQLAAGTYTIPDLSGRIPVWSAFNLRLFPPKTVEQYTAFIVEHLALLLGPSPLPVSVAPMPWSMIVFLTLPYVLSILMFIQAKLSKWLGATSALVFLGAFALLYVTATIGQWKTLLGQGPPTRLSIHLTELYWYLRQAYSDNPPGDDELPDPAKPRL